jgi:hypothetical protein
MTGGIHDLEPPPAPGCAEFKRLVPDIFDGLQAISSAVITSDASTPVSSGIVSAPFTRWKKQRIGSLSIPGSAYHTPGISASVSR